MQLRKITILAGLLIIHFIANAQADLKGWHLLDPGSDSLHGISLQRTYDFLKGKKSQPVVVAVIDSGIDTAHEDLKNILWRNTKEIPGNGIDDDGNGYIDDVHGWNFIGGKDGRNIGKESMEASRVYHRYKEKFDKKHIDESKLTSTEKEEYALWKKAAELLNIDRDEQVAVMFLEVAYKAAKKHEKVLISEMKKESFTAEEVEKFQPTTQPGKQAKMGYLTFLKITEMEREETNTSMFSQLEEYLADKKMAQDAKEIAPVNYREEIIKDDYFNIGDRYYGNNDVMGPSPTHGTHVSGIIAAERNNGVGVDGVASNVKIMTIRAVPDGDEYDKDIALAIKYAVDNGAKVINMSFGKGLSPEKKWVDEAVRYAELKDVLLVHAAGNDGKNNDEEASYPNRNLKTYNSTASNFISVGASSDFIVSNNLVADFSNYGKSSVDVFAPGVKIYSTLPGGNAYGFQKGTSMAAPVVSGVAAIIRSHFPKLSAKQVKYAIEASVDKFDNTPVNKPGSKEKTAYSELCTSGGKINAYRAIKLASTLQPEVKEVKKEQLPPSTFKNMPVKQ
ncbi:S8 family peptidase [Aridibaculum aurantiacum]|uniref:S8 family peptidase n=1 Tax=Aridibaculum aurantiacum TaxID=2810307 RepID=UPI001A97C34B|nr:S8 family peptidase [Aridibaculum aurantiacum]